MFTDTHENNNINVLKVLKSDFKNNAIIFKGKLKLICFLVPLTEL